VKTIGVSPKVKNPALAGIAAGIALFILGLILKDADLKQIGVTVFLAALGYGGIGFQSNPGVVTEPLVGPANDEMLAHHDRVDPEQ
jgi:xanthine/uracil/vitamin C permease (AzgA family)